MARLSTVLEKLALKSVDAARRWDTLEEPDVTDDPRDSEPPRPLRFCRRAGRRRGGSDSFSVFSVCSTAGMLRRVAIIGFLIKAMVW